MQQARIKELKRLKGDQHLSYETLGRQLGVHWMSVYRWLQKGVVPRNRLVLRSIDRLLSRYGYSNSKPRKVERGAKIQALNKEEGAE